MARSRLHGTDVRTAAWRVALAIMPTIAAHTFAATVTVKIEGVRNDHGQVLVAICTRADFLRPHCPWKTHAPAHTGEVVLSLDTVPPGRYAAQAFHDENSNSRLDRNLLGMPQEGMGFSNNAPMRMGPPAFDSAAFDVGSRDVIISFAVKYF